MLDISLKILFCVHCDSFCGVIFAFRLHATRQLEIICLIIYAFKILFSVWYTFNNNSKVFPKNLSKLIHSNTVKLEIFVLFYLFLVYWKFQFSEVIVVLYYNIPTSSLSSELRIKKNSTWRNYWFHLELVNQWVYEFGVNFYLHLFALILISSLWTFLSWYYHVFYAWRENKF